MKSGTIKLMQGAYCLKRLHYYSVKDRKDIMGRWREQYGFNMFEKLAVQIVPDIDLITTIARKKGLKQD